MSNNNVSTLIEPGCLDDQPAEILRRQGARTLLAGAAEAEVADCLASTAVVGDRAPRQRHRFDAARIVAADCFVSLSRTPFGLRGAPFPLVSCRGT